MKNHYVTIVAAVFLMFMLIAGCKSDPNEPSPGLEQLFTELEKPLETATFQAENEFEYKSESGRTRITIFANSLEDEAGKSVTGAVVMEFREIFSKGDMIRYKKPTQTIDGRGLESDGELYIGLSQNGKALRLKPASQVRIDIYPEYLTYDMDVFYGSENPETGLFGWEDDGTPDIADVAIIIDSLNWEFPYIQFFSKRLAWINCDAFWGVPDYLTTRVCAKLPSGFNIENTSVHLIFTKRNSVMQFGDISSDGRVFCYNNIPLNDSVLFFALSEIEEDGKKVYYMANPVATVTSGLQVELVPVKTSLADIEAFLSGL